MPVSIVGFRGSPSQWALTSRARLAVIAALSAAACSSSQPSAPGDDEPGGDPSGSASHPGSGGTDGVGTLVTVALTGPGRITSRPAGIDCGDGATACAARFTAASIALATDGGTTVRWGGACSGNGDCALTLGAERQVTAATFAPLRITYDGADHGSDACFAIAAGPGDEIIATGEVQRFSQGHNAWVRAYSAAGSLAWSYELSTPSEGHDRGNGVIALPDGGAVVAGTWFSGSNSHWNSFALDLGATGAPAWSALGEMIGDDRYNAVARGGDGRIIAAGDRIGGDGQNQAWMRAVAADGATELWSIARDGGAAGNDTAAGVAIDSAGDVVAAGSEVNPGTGSDGWIAKYAATGELRWSIPVAGDGAAIDSIAAVAIGPSDAIAAVGSVGGAATIRLYSAAGAPIWTVAADDGAVWSGVAVTAAGDVVVAGSLGSDLAVRKYSAAGALLWQRTIPGASGTAVAVDSAGSVLVCGSINQAGSKDALLVAYPQ